MIEENPPGADNYWATMSVFRKLAYLVGAFMIGSLLGAIPGAALRMLLPDLSPIIVGVLVLVGVVAGVWFIYRGMRDDVNYVHSAEYAQRNPDL